MRNIYQRAGIIIGDDDIFDTEFFVIVVVVNFCLSTALFQMKF